MEDDNIDMGYLVTLAPPLTARPPARPPHAGARPGHLLQVVGHVTRYRHLPCQESTTRISLCEFKVTVVNDCRLREGETLPRV